MASTPLFQTRAALVEQLRMSGAPTATDAQVIVDQVILEARTTFYRRLGITRVAQLVAYTPVDPPITEEAILRQVALETEAKIVLSLLMRRLPMLFVDGSGNRDQVWNDEGSTRQAADYERIREGKRLDVEIKANFDLLAGIELGEQTSMKMMVIEPDDTPELPGATTGWAS